MRRFVMKTVKKKKKSLFSHPGIKVCSAVLNQTAYAKTEKNTGSEKKSWTFTQ